MKKIERHHYQPTEAQRAELRVASELMRQRLAAKRRARVLEQAGHVTPSERAFLDDLHTRASAARFAK